MPSGKCHHIADTGMGNEKATKRMDQGDAALPSGEELAARAEARARVQAVADAGKAGSAAAHRQATDDPQLRGTVRTESPGRNGDVLRRHGGSREAPLQ